MQNNVALIPVSLFVFFRQNTYLDRIFSGTRFINIIWNVNFIIIINTICIDVN